MFLFFLVLIQIASSGSTSATTTTKIVIGHSTEGGGSTFSHFRVSLPNIHGSKQGAAKDRIYNEDSIKIEEYVSHLEDYMTNLPHFDFSSVKIEQLQLEDLTIDREHSTQGSEVAGRDSKKAEILEQDYIIFQNDRKRFKSNCL